MRDSSFYLLWPGGFSSSAASLRRRQESRFHIFIPSAVSGDLPFLPLLRGPSLLSCLPRPRASVNRAVSCPEKGRKMARASDLILVEGRGFNPAKTKCAQCALSIALFLSQQVFASSRGPDVLIARSQGAAIDNDRET